LMRSLKSGVLSVLLAGLAGVGIVVGCSAQGATRDLDPNGNANPTEPTSSKLPPRGETPPEGPADDEDEEFYDGGKGDAGRKDGGKDAGKDAAKEGGSAGPPPPPPNTGESCPLPNAILRRSCGLCGTQDARCLASTNKVGEYGPCRDEILDGCYPGSTDEVACGKCGTVRRTCSDTCKWPTNATCTGEPVDGCTVGSIELIGAGCPEDRYVQRQCSATCTWGNISETCTEAPSFVNVPPNVNSVNSTIIALKSSQTMVRLPSSGSCPLTNDTVTDATPYAYVEVRNSNRTPVRVTIYNSKEPYGKNINTIMAAYDSPTLPSTPEERKMCRGSVADVSPEALSGFGEFAALQGNKSVAIAGNSSVYVYVGAFYKFDPASPSTTTGKLLLNVRTDSVAP
jgi:hypothetical protein